MVLSILVVLSDLYARRVPNAWLMAAMLLSVIVPIIEAPHGKMPSCWPSLWGLGVGLVVMLPFYAVGWMGAGDVKLFAVLGLLLGVRCLPPIWLAASALTALHTAVMVLLRVPRLANASMPMFLRMRICDLPWWRRMLRSRRGRAGQPYAAYLGIATIITVSHPGLASWSFP
ncbi:A24 family peptidase [Dyella amyloliquefaciens]|uniref:A24 family peptidase n=1 Tax=Dyella amyloliquefaciens TaxID=1770545 RepID=UPI00102E92FE|nr:prepilin peptidase [Dyella amyloliquefaciens]